MKKEELINWFQSEKSNIETIFLNAAIEFVSKHEKFENFGFDLSESQNESYNLSKGQDLCYDRFSTPLSYSLWYQARRLNLFITNFSDKIVESLNSTQPTEIFDLGAGTGSVQFCFGLAAVAKAKISGTIPLIRIINVDSSPQMLSYLRTYLWPAAKNVYPELNQIYTEYHVYSWVNRADVRVTNPWICASYLFDSSDNEEYLADNFRKIISTFDPGVIMMLTSNQSLKVALMTRLKTELNKLGYSEMSSNVNENVFNGSIEKLNTYRIELLKKYNAIGANNLVSWNDRSFVAMGLQKMQRDLTLSNRALPDNIQLFNPPMIVRRDVILNEDQKKASIFETRPVIITGPAGCGKSVVITEKLINILENFRWATDIKILVTTFNKGLISQLRIWLFDLLEKKGKRYSFNQYVDINEGSGEIIVHGQAVISIKLMHFEILGKFIGNVRYRAFDEDYHKKYLLTEIENVKRELNIGSSFEDVMNPEFLLEEYHRVIYGLSCDILSGESAYQNIDRIGRGEKKINKNSQRRKAIHIVLSRYKKWMGEENPNGNSFTERRKTFLNVLESGNFNKQFDYIFIDEFQDCTQADFKTMILLLKDVNNLVITGDLAQSVHIGQSCKVPRDGNMRNRSFHKLTGSYRLPYRISEALSPLSKRITEKSSDPEVTVGISPYKGAPPGSRPIIVYAPNTSQLSDKIVSIKNLYSIFNLAEITILEKDEDLKQSLKSKNEIVDTSTILRLKGLEKSFVVWSLQAEIEFEDESLEFAYTIMTRTNCILVLALTDASKSINVEKLQYLRNDRLIIWDADTKKNLERLNLFKIPR